MEKPKSKLNYNEYEKFFARETFCYNDTYKPVRDLIDNKFEKFFKKLLNLNPDENKKKELQECKQDLKEIFYNDAFQRISNNTYLIDVLETSMKLQSNVQRKEPGGNDLLLSDIANLNVSDVFNPMINELFKIPNLILSAFDITSKSFKKQIHEQNQKLSDSKKLKPEDPAYKTYMGFVNRMIENNITKHKVVRDYWQNNKSINQSDKSLSNAFDSFLKNHQSEIIKKYRLTKRKFNSKFFPASLSKK